MFFRETKPKKNKNETKRNETKNDKIHFFYIYIYIFISIGICTNISLISTKNDNKFCIYFLKIREN